MEVGPPHDGSIVSFTPDHSGLLCESSECSEEAQAPHRSSRPTSWVFDVTMTINSLRAVQPLSKCLETCAICTPEQKESSGDLTLTQFSNCTLK